MLTGVSNARSESLNRIAKLEARQAYSFRNPANQRRRVRTACTRGRRHRTLPNQEQITSGNRTATRSRLTSKNQHWVSFPALLVVSYSARERSPGC